MGNTATKRALSLYWKCQLAGWTAASLYWGYTGYTSSRFLFSVAVLHFLLDLMMYIGLTHVFRKFSLRMQWEKLAPGPLVVRLIPSLLILGGLFLLLTVVKTYYVREWLSIGDGSSFSQFFSKQWLPILGGGVRLLAIWLLAYYLYHFAQRESSAKHESARLALIAKDAQLKNLEAQLNPHFFFNALNNIKSLVLENQENARRAIDLLSDLLRSSLYGRDQSLITLENELALVNDYLELEKIRFEQRLQTTVHVDKELLPALILPFSIQTLVENAVKHGIATTRDGGSVKVEVTSLETKINIEVTNPGIFAESTSEGLGIKNLAERLQLQYNGLAKLEVKSNGDGQVKANLLIPKP